MTEQADKYRSQGNSGSCEQTSFNGYRSGGFPSRPEAAIEHYEYECYGAYVSNQPTPVRCEFVIPAAAQQTEHQEEEKDRYPDLSGKLVEEYAGEDNHRENQKEQ